MNSGALKVGLMGLVITALAGCETVSETAESWYGSAKGVITGARSDRSYFARQTNGTLDEADAILISHQAAMALETAPAGKPVSWHNPETGVRAAFIPKETVYETRDVVAARTKGIAATRYTRLVGRTYVSQKNANLRAGPSTGYAIVGRLRKGESFSALGEVRGARWLVVGSEGRAVGYVFAPLVKPADPARTIAELREADDSGADVWGDDVVVHTVSVATPCRLLEYTVATADGKVTDSTLRACKAGDGAWEIVPSNVADRSR